MKKVLYLLIVFVVFSCSSNDDSDNDEPSFDVNLLFGQWYRIDMCNDQNSLLLNQDYTFIKNSSGNVDCSVNERDTYQYTGNFSVSNDNISFNQLTEEVIIEGTSTSVNEFELTTLLYTKVAQLDENNLVIERKFRVIASGEENIYATSYER